VDGAWLGAIAVNNENDDERRHDALLAFMSAGLPAPPATAFVVSALADARRSVVAYQARGEPIDDWLASQIRLRGSKRPPHS
jgi:hypothetical protein